MTWSIIGKVGIEFFGVGLRLHLEKAFHFLQFYGPVDCIFFNNEKSRVFALIA